MWFLWQGRKGCWRALRRPKPANCLCDALRAGTMRALPAVLQRAVLRGKWPSPPCLPFGSSVLFNLRPAARLPECCLPAREEVLQETPRCQPMSAPASHPPHPPAPCPQETIRISFGGGTYSLGNLLPNRFKPADLLDVGAPEQIGSDPLLSLFDSLPPLSRPLWPSPPFPTPWHLLACWRAWAARAALNISIRPM